MAHMASASRSSAVLTALVVAALIVGAVVLGLVSVIIQAGPREIVTLLLAVLAIILLLAPSEQIVTFGFATWILTFAFGWRTFHVTDNLNIHPAEALAWLLFFTLVARGVVRRTPLDFSLPRPVLALMLFAVLGMGVAASRGTRMDVAFQEAKIVLTLLPSYYVVKWLVLDRTVWERAARLTVGVAIYVSCLGLLDYFLPGVSLALAGRSSGETIAVAESLAGESFSRVGFIFYGNYSAGFLIFTFFGLSVFYLLSNRGKKPDAFTVAILAVGVELIAMYVSGYRGLWYALGVFLLAYALVSRRAWLLLGAAAASVPLLPADFFYRLFSVFDWRYADSSQFSRLDRATEAFKLMLNSPLTGVGWGGSGYVHSDLIQLGANLGILALGVFVLWILSMLWQLFWLARQQEWAAEYAAALFATVCGLLVVFTGEGLIVWAQLMVPAWFLLSMAERLKELSRPAVRASE